MFEKINNYEKSIHYYNLGNDLKRKNIDYSIDYDKKRFDVIKKIIDKFGTNEKKNIGYKNSFTISLPKDKSAFFSAMTVIQIWKKLSRKKKS